MGIIWVGPKCNCKALYRKARRMRVKEEAETTRTKSRDAVSLGPEQTCRRPTETFGGKEMDCSLVPPDETDPVNTLSLDQ